MFIAHRRKSDGVEQSVAEHLRGVSQLARRYAQKLGMPAAGELIGLLHDLGKYSQHFQAYLRSAEGLLDPDEDQYVDADAMRGRIDHSSAGAQHIFWKLRGRSPEAELVGRLLGLCVASHHSGLIDCVSSWEGSYGRDALATRLNKDVKLTHLEEALRNADAEVLVRAEEIMRDQSLVQSVVQRMQLVGKRNDGRIQLCWLQMGFAVRMLFSCLLDADRTDTADFERGLGSGVRQHGKYESWNALVERLEAHIGRWAAERPIDEMRRRISACCRDAASRSPGAYTLTVPTGGGKTLASLRFALHHAERRGLDRILYVIPFTTIIDQNAEVVRQILETAPGEGRIVLEHHSNLTPETQTWREKILTENWDAPIVFTTMVQFLESFFGAGTRGARRLHQLANAVVIFDEVQTIPLKCVHLFSNAVNFLVEQCNSTIVLCTATQPLLHQVDQRKGAVRLVLDHEMMPECGEVFDALRRVEVRDRRKAKGWTYAEIAALAMEEVKAQGSCLVVVNTKESARRVFQECVVPDATARIHLSTDMCPAHRKERLEFMRRRLDGGEPTLCVSTQLVEAGVDIDFRVVIRFLAGLDSIAQAAGRCNRHGSATPGTVYVVNPAEESLSNLHEIQVAAECAQRVLDDYRANPSRFRGDLFGPDAMAVYYRYYFFERQAEMDYPVKLEHGGSDTLLNLLGANEKAVAAWRRTEGDKSRTPAFRPAFFTGAGKFKAIDAPTRGVVVPYAVEGRRVVAELSAAFDVDRQCQLLRRSQQFTVNVYPQQLDHLARSGAVRKVQEETDILCLDERHYSEEFGLSLEPIVAMRTQNV